ncbi:MAG: TetR/AcrR family transcriptional regulator [Actinomycetota bacterium]|nr:TetR/AcrR family transcriptional regulator [Actinomycetota bacterium]
MTPSNERDGTAPPAAAATPLDDLTPRARRTRAALVAAARTVFEERGFLDTRISDITRAAGVAHGSFYTYFPTKQAVFREVAIELTAEISAAGRSVDDHGDGAATDVVARIERVNRRYLQVYLENAEIYGVLEQVASFDDEMLALRRELRRDFLERNRRAIARWQAQGIADPDLDPLHTAAVLGAMVERHCYIWFVTGERFDHETSLRTLNAVWVRSLGLDRRERADATTGAGLPDTGHG